MYKNKDADAERILKAIKLRFSQNFANDTFLMDEMKCTVTEFHSLFENTVYVDFTTRILGQENVQKYLVNVEIPKNWWQHFLQDVFKIKGIKTKIITRTIEFTHCKLFPDLKINKPDAARIEWYTPKPHISGVAKIKNDEFPL